MRKLITRDAFKLMQMLHSVGAKDGFAEIIDMYATKADVEKIGAKLFSVVFDMMGQTKTEDAVCALLADVSEKTPDDIQNLPLNELIQLVKDIVAENDMSAFFGQAVPTT